MVSVTRKPSFLRTFLLLCLLAIGPLQAQVAFACAMMDTVVHDDCCCDDHGAETDCLRAECGSPPDAEQAPCCDLSVEIGVDQETRQHTPSFKPLDQRLDVDPPPALVAILDIFPASQASAPAEHSFDQDVLRTGSDTWLVTRRLRI